ITALHSAVDDSPVQVLEEVNGLLNLFTVSDRDQVLAVLRLRQLGLGDVGNSNEKGFIWEGYSPRKPVKEIRERLGMWLWKETADKLWLAIDGRHDWSQDELREFTRTF